MHNHPITKRKFILGTDWWTDCDDAVAIRLLARAAKRGDIDLLGIAINACMEHSVASLKGYLASEGLTDVPLGIDLTATNPDDHPPYQTRLAKNLCPSASNADAIDALRLYRMMLATAEAPVEIIEIGFPQVLAALIESLADDVSPKTGLELLLEKVSKFWIMAGKWDRDGEKEHNFCHNVRSRVAAEKLCRLCPVPITFLGWEIGCEVITGAKLAKDDVLHKILVDHGSANGRSSWDPMTVQLALIGDEAAAGYDTVRGTARVDAETGANYFIPSESGSHQYVVRNFDVTYYENAINEAIASRN
ncbi:MAG: hypothetical protein IJX80_08095 [Clostridia bacterium]|nr:hypothetical protein [Clostridia bacterium]